MQPGESLGERANCKLSKRGERLLEFANNFILCSVNLLNTYHGPAETFISQFRMRYRLTIDYIMILNSISNNLFAAKTFDWFVDNTSDHVPV